MWYNKNLKILNSITTENKPLKLENKPIIGHGIDVTLIKQYNISIFLIFDGSFLVKNKSNLFLFEK